jgi:hypothetical protein
MTNAEEHLCCDLVEVLRVRTACPERSEGAGVEPQANGSTRRHFECERRELNPHPLRDRILSPARLPVSPRSR